MDDFASSRLVFGELLHSIFSYSKTDDLIRFRQVSRAWRNEANRALRFRKDFEIPFTYCIHSPEPTFVRNCEFSEAKCRMGSKFRCKFGSTSINSKRKTLTELNEFIYQIYTLYPAPDDPAGLYPASFFATRFRFEYFYGHLDLPEVQTFFRLHGNNIRGLTVENYDTYYLGQYGWSKTILSFTPNLEYLTIIIKMTEKILTSRLPDLQMQIKQQKLLYQQLMAKGDSTTATKSPRLRYLKAIEIREHLLFPSLSTPTILPSLLNLSSPGQGNLEKVYFPNGLSLNLLPMFGPSKVHLLSIDSLQLDLFSDCKLKIETNIQLLTQSSVKLRKLHISVYKPPENYREYQQACGLVRKIIQANQKTISIVHLEGAATHLLKTIEGLPPLLNVNTIIVSTKYYEKRLLNSGEYPWRNFNSSEDEEDDEDTVNAQVLPNVFPNVEHFEMSSYGVRPMDQAWFPCWNSTFSSVRSLLISTSSINSPFKLEKLSGMFPGVRDLKISFTSREFQESAKYLWELKELRSLNLKIYGPQSSPISKNWMDSTLTGFSDKRAEKILNVWEKTGKWRDDFSVIEKRGDSLLNLQKLQVLKLKFVFSYLHFEEPSRMLSGVSGHFAFAPLKNLQVLITAKYAGPEKKAKISRLFNCVTCFANVKLINKPE